MNILLKISLLLVAIILINIPFGYWRANSPRFSWQWIMAVHVPVPIAIGLRLMFLGWIWLLVPAFVAAYSLGQFVGGRLRPQLAKQGTQLSSCLMSDLVKTMRPEQQPDAEG
jgi:hypothetical protein